MAERPLIQIRMTPTLAAKLEAFRQAQPFLPTMTAVINQGMEAWLDSQLAPPPQRKAAPPALRGAPRPPRQDALRLAKAKKAENAKRYRARKKEEKAATVAPQ